MEFGGRAGGGERWNVEFYFVVSLSSGHNKARLVVVKETDRKALDIWYHVHMGLKEEVAKGLV